MKKYLLPFLGVALLAQAPAGNKLTVMEGAGVRVSLALQGFSQDQGLAKLSDQHTRLGMYSASDKTKESIGGPLIVSVISHELPKGADFPKMGSAIALDKLRSTVLNPLTEDDSFIQIKRYKSPKGLYLFFIEDHTSEKEPFRQFQFYFEYINNGVWVEIHMSMPTPANSGPKKGIGPVMDMVDSIIDSLTVQKT